MNNHKWHECDLFLTLGSPLGSLVVRHLIEKIYFSLRIISFDTGVLHSLFHVYAWEPQEGERVWDDYCQYYLQPSHKWKTQ